MTTEPAGDGSGCKCGAYYQGECGCSEADWTPREVYELRAKLSTQSSLLKMAEEALEEIFNAHMSCEQPTDEEEHEVHVVHDIAKNALKAIQEGREK